MSLNTFNTLNTLNMLNLNVRAILIILFIFLLAIACIVLSMSKKTNIENIENMINLSNNYDIPKWTRSASCKYKMNSTTYDVLDDNKIIKCSKKEEADLIFPCGYNNIDGEIQSLPHLEKRIKTNTSNNQNSPKIVFIIDNADEITAKNYLWKNLVNYYGLSLAKMISPNTYILTKDVREQNIKRLKDEHVDGKLYIMKKNIQRQTGLEITDSIEQIEAKANDYVLAQELLVDSYLVNKRKINLRVYVVVICYKDKTDVYVYNNGLMYYTKAEFDRAAGPEMDSHVTTGYVEREVYEHNPLTHKDFIRYLDLKEGKKYHPNSPYARQHTQEEKNIITYLHSKISDEIFVRINNLIRNVFAAFKDNICRKTNSNGNDIPIYNDYSVQIFGADVAIDTNLIPKIIEINKGPDLSPKDERDSAVKKGLVDSVMSLIKLTKKTPNDLKLVLEM